MGDDFDKNFGVATLDKIIINFAIKKMKKIFFATFTGNCNDRDFI